MERETDFTRTGRCRSRGTACRRTAPGSGTATTTRAGARRRSCTRSASRGCSGIRASRRRRAGAGGGRRPLHVHRRDTGRPTGASARTTTKGSADFKTCSRHRRERARHRRVVRVLAPRPASGAEGRDLVRGSSTGGASTPRRCRVVPGRLGCASLRLSATAPTGTRVVVAKQVYRRLVEAGAGRAPASALRQAARPARDGPESARRTSRRAPRAGESTLLGQIASAPGSGSCTGA